MKLGLALPHYDQGFPDAGPATFERVAGYAERAEAIGLSQLWVSDHFWLNLDRYGGPPARRGSLECWTTLSALAVRTRRVRLGSLVMAVGFRSPTLLAKMAATLDQLMGGRLDLGLGAGWNEDEFRENDLPFPPPGERLAMLEEALGVLDALLTGGEAPVSYSGRHYHAHNAQVIPGPVQRPRPPLWVGGGGDRLLGVVARAADGWNVCWAITPERYDQRLKVLGAACDRAGRSVGEVRRSVGLATLIGRDADDLVERWRRMPSSQTPSGIFHDSDQTRRSRTSMCSAQVSSSRQATRSSSSTWPPMSVKAPNTSWSVRAPMRSPLKPISARIAAWRSRALARGPRPSLRSQILRATRMTPPGASTRRTSLSASRQPAMRWNTWTSITSSTLESRTGILVAAAHLAGGGARPAEVALAR